MTKLRMRILALSISFFGIAGILAAAETPGFEGSDDAAPDVAAAPAEGPMVAAAQPPAPVPLPVDGSAGTVASQKTGPVTGLPLPRFVSMKSDRVNIRRGPSKTHRVDWEFLRRDMPVEVVAEYGHWRQIRDHDGVGGWVHYVMISGNRTVLVEQDMLPLRYQPSADARIVAKLEQGVIADLGRCEIDWCRLSVNGFKGWAPKTAIWGVFPDELRD